MKKYLIVGTTRDRKEMLTQMLQSANEHLSGWNIAACAQQYTKEEADKLFEQSLAKEKIVISKAGRIGMHNAKMACVDAVLQKEQDEIVFCSVDDDMVFTNLTQYETAIRKCLEKGVGMVSTGWVKSETMIAKRPTKDEFVKQSIVYTGGGLLFSRTVAGVLQALPRRDYISDNTVHSLALYIAGYENFRYRGSLAIHKILSKGGRRAWVSLGLRELPSREYISMKQDKSSPNDYLIGTSKDITEAAHQIHRRNRATLMNAA